MRRNPCPADPLVPSLRFDKQVTSLVRVRRWHHQGRRKTWDAAVHPGVEVAWVQRGEASYRVGQRTKVVKKGTAIVVPAGTEHATTVGEASVVSSLWLDTSLVHGVAGAMGRTLGSRPLFLPATQACQVATLGTLLQKEADQSQPGQATAIEALAEALTVMLIRLCPGDEPVAPSKDPRIQTAVDQINSCYSQEVKVEDLARCASMSRYHFSRLFRQSTGLSPYQYLIKTRVERAAELLRAGRHSVTDAALSVGFSDLSRFSRVFRSHHGVLPREMCCRA